MDHPPPPPIPDYELLRVIGRGSYGDVWLARTLTGVYRAVKVVGRDRFTRPEPFDREFSGLREFAAVSLVDANQLALLHVGGGAEAGFFYYVMEAADDAVTGRQIDPGRYVPLTLAELRRRRGRMPVAEVLEIGIAVTRGLAGLHVRGLIHRDIKPSNVIVVSGRAKLADVGLLASVSAAGSLVGTEGFIPPEGPGSRAADVYGLGKVLYELLSGLDASEFPRLPETPSDAAETKALFKLNDVILRACDPSPSVRYPDAPALLTDLLALQEGRPRRKIRWRRLAPVGAVIIAVGLVLAVLRWFPNSTRPLDPADGRSIAVLPFANRSEGADAGAFFADGMQEDLISALASIDAFHVTSRTTSDQYRNTAKSLAQIGRELGVSYILEGSVLRAGNQMRIIGELIDVSSDRLVWSRSFDRKVSEVFGVQGEIASQIAATLNTALNPGEQTLVKRPRTSSMAAYDLYLKAREDRHSQLRSELNDHNQEGWLTQAVKLDPAFAEAWALLAEVHAFEYFTDYDHTPARRTLAREAIEAAVKLAPDSSYVRMEQGAVWYYAYRDYDQAIATFRAVERREPKNADAEYWLMSTYRRAGRWPEALRAGRRAVALDPANLPYLRTLATTLDLVRRFDEAAELTARQIKLLPAPAFDEHLTLASENFNRDGSTAVGDAFFRQLPPEIAAGAEATKARSDWAGTKGDWAEVVRMNRETSHSPTESADDSLEMALVYRALGKTSEARARLGEQPAQLRAKLQRQPENASALAQLGAMDLILGNTEDASSCADRAERLEPDDPIYAAPISRLVCFVELGTGRRSSALAKIRQAMSQPNAANPSVFQVKTDPAFAALHGDPEFEALMRDPKYREPLF